MLRQYHIKNYDFKLILLVVALTVVGIVTIGSANSEFQDNQIMGLFMGLFAMVVVSLIDYSFVLRFFWVIYGINLILLALVRSPLGESTNNSQRWVNLFGLRFQPSELTKILLILFFAQFIMKYREKLNTVRIICSCVVLVAVPWYLIYRQPDLSTSIVVIAIFCVVMFAGGISWKLVVGVLAVAVPAVALLVSLMLQPDSSIDLLEGFQLNRIMAFVNPEEYKDTLAYQQLNSVTAIASGQLDGKGYRNNEITSVKNGNFISEAQTDFIFAVIGEEFGFKGSVLVIALMFGISLECISVARHAKDLAGTIIAAGVGGLVAFQGFINIGVATFILPNTGLPLPFVSYGLTSLMSLFMGMGFVLNVRLQAKKTK